MHPVPEDEASPPPADPGVRVAPPGGVVHGPPTVGLDVGAVHRHHLPYHGPGLDQHPREPAEDQLVRLLAEAEPELGEEAVARGPAPEAAGPR